MRIVSPKIFLIYSLITIGTGAMLASHMPEAVTHTAVKFAIKNFLEDLPRQNYNNALEIGASLPENLKCPSVPSGQFRAQKYLDGYGICNINGNIVVINTRSTKIKLIAEQDFIYTWMLNLGA